MKFNKQQREQIKTPIISTCHAFVFATRAPITSSRYGSFIIQAVEWKISR